MAFPEELLAEGEEIVIDQRPSWWAMSRPAAWVVVGVLGVWAGVGLIPDGGAATLVKVVVLAQAAKLIALTGVFQILRWARTEYTLTSHRLMVRYGVFRRSVWEVPLSEIARFSVEFGPIEQRLGAGTIVIETRAWGQDRTLKNFPRTDHACRRLTLVCSG